jgi:hypothetical protein
MQNYIVFIAVAGAVIFIGLRLWKTLRHPDKLSCGCGCSGCSSVSACSPPKTPFPLCKK